MQTSEATDQPDKRGGWRGGGRPKKFGKDIETITVSARVPAECADEARARPEEMVEEFAARLERKINSL